MSANCRWRTGSSTAATRCRRRPGRRPSPAAAPKSWLRNRGDASRCRPHRVLDLRSPRTRRLEMKIGSAARAAGPAVQTVRYGDETGLVSPGERTRSGGRHGTATDLGKQILARRVRAFGCTIEEARLPPSVYEDGNRSSADVRRLAVGRLSETGSRLHELEALRDEHDRPVGACTGVWWKRSARRDLGRGTGPLSVPPGDTADRPACRQTDRAVRHAGTRHRAWRICDQRCRSTVTKRVDLPVAGTCR